MNMKIIGMCIFMAMPLVGCASTPEKADIVVTVPKPIVPPEQFFVCHLRKLPDHFDDNKEVASYLNKIYSDNEKCKYNMNSLKEYTEKARKEFDN